MKNRVYDGFVKVDRVETPDGPREVLVAIMTLSWFSGTILAGNRHLWFGSWERVEKMCAALQVKKLAYLGSKLSTEGGRDWTKSGLKPSNPFGHLRDRLIDGQTVRVYGLPLMNIGPESIRYFQALNDTEDANE